jgi:fluoroquinolone resistance protein
MFATTSGNKMDNNYTEEKTFEKTDFTRQPLVRGEYEYCTFINCDFSNTDLSDIKFMECKFEGCNLSMVRLNNTALRDCTFVTCKMLGLHFEHCNEFGLSASFDNCNLTHSSFYKTKFKKTSFKNLILHDVDFTECDLSGSVFDNCDLTMAAFNSTILEKADFRSSFNYSIDPEANKIRKARFSIHGITGLLDKYGIEIS